jgi:hypothetical protein
VEGLQDGLYWWEVIKNNGVLRSVRVVT